MFEISCNKCDILTPLLTVAGAVDKKQSVAILSNILLRFSGNTLLLTATDLEIEITASVPCIPEIKNCLTTVPAKKFVDIIRSLDDDSSPTFIIDDKNLTIKSGRSRFKLACLPGDTYPDSKDEVNEVEFSLPRLALIELLQSTHFALSQQDIRVYLNGLLLEIEPNGITAVAMDGHRMAISKFQTQLATNHHRIVIPKKGVQEVIRLLNNIDDEKVSISAGKNHFQLKSSQYKFVSKLIETRFPVYMKAVPRGQDKQVIISRDALKRALMRITILANEKSRAVKLLLESDQLSIIANNPEQEEASEEISAQTRGDSLQIGLNASYLLDVLNYVEAENVRISMSDTSSSILVEPEDRDTYQYIIMPMKI